MQNAIRLNSVVVRHYFSDCLADFTGSSTNFQHLGGENFMVAETKTFPSYAVALVGIEAPCSVRIKYNLTSDETSSHL